jgi:hypothetical protein
MVGIDYNILFESQQHSLVNKKEVGGWRLEVGGLVGGFSFQWRAVLLLASQHGSWADDGSMVEVVLLLRCC